jgi:hypothetical protein
MPSEWNSDIKDGFSFNFMFGGTEDMEKKKTGHIDVNIDRDGVRLFAWQWKRHKNESGVQNFFYKYTARKHTK